MTFIIIFWTVILFVLIFLLGASVGSFCGVCIGRLPKNITVVKGRSHCDSCGHVLSWKDLIPVFGYIFLHGKCRYCNAKIGIRGEIIEIISGLIYLFSFMLYMFYFPNPEFIFFPILCSCLIIVFFMDFDTQLINMNVVLCIGIIGIIKTIYNTIANKSINVIWSALLGAAICGIPLLAIAFFSKERAMGYGDGFLMLACGLYLGIKCGVSALFIGLIIGSVWGLINKYATKESRFAFGPSLCIGVFFGDIFGEIIANWYLSLIGIS